MRESRAYRSHLGSIASEASRDRAAIGGDSQVCVSGCVKRKLEVVVAGGYFWDELFAVAAARAIDGTTSQARAVKARVNIRSLVSVDLQKGIAAR